MKDFLVKHPFISLLMLDCVVTGVVNIGVTIANAAVYKQYTKKRRSYDDREEAKDEGSYECDRELSEGSEDGQPVAEGA